MSSDSAISAWLSRITSRGFAPRPAAEVQGGSIHHCVRWPGEGGDAFVKLASSERLDVFETEAAGLGVLEATGALRVPRVLGLADVAGQAVLALEWLELTVPQESDAALQAQLGERLATLHRYAAPRFGWDRDNYLGATPQPNAWDDDWVRFFRERRLGYQLELAATRGLQPGIVDRGRELGERCGAFFSSHRPVPSLLHGDLWGGNWARVAGTREAAIFDPAVYYGDREADLAMTRLFGGFGPRFYAAYQSAWPLDQAAGTRRTLYNLYHVLNHFNLFGGAYAQQAAGMIDRLLAESGA
jgi:protein-ribulosamine 3-kinase